MQADRRRSRLLGSWISFRGAATSSVVVAVVFAGFLLPVPASATGSNQFLISPTALDFGSVPVGTTSAQQTVTITNVSGSSLVMSGTGGAAGEFGGSQNCQGKTLAAGASCQMFYAFTPTAVGPVTGSTNGTWNGQAFQMTFTGSGINQFLISPTGLDFGSVPVGTTSAQQTVTITNVSESSVVMSGTGGAAGEFGGSQNCQGKTLAAGASCQMFYAFTPTAVGPVTGSTNGTWNGQAFQMTFTGTGIATSPAPVVASVTPGSGPTTGGTLVTITGSGFAGASNVSFGAVPATTFTVISGTEINAVSPAQPTASVWDVFVITPTGGASTALSADRFTYVAAPPVTTTTTPPVTTITPPAVTKVFPRSGPTKGGTRLKITGTGFSGATRVMFGTIPAKRFTIVSSTEVTAVSPPQAASVRNIRVTTAGGTSSTVHADRFTYVKRPAVTGLAPRTGPTTGGTRVKIKGAGFAGATRVMFGTIPAKRFTIVSGTEITAVSPPQAASVRNIRVTTAGGTSSTVHADQFTYK
jgi:hypothetical protein